MKKIFAIFIYFIVFLISLIAFLSKESMYNLAENELVKKDIVISNEIKEEKLFGIVISNANVYYQGINIGKFDNISLSSYLFFSRIDISNVSVLDSFALIIPNQIKDVSIEHSILAFNKIKINSNGTFGNLKGEFDIFTRSLRIQLIASDEMKNKYSKILKSMKLENGEYIYEYKF